jgi:hypothetical protein
MDPGTQVPGKLIPGFWGNIRRLATLGPFAERLREAAIHDLIDNGGRGQNFRDEVLALEIPGVGPKVASFAWLALNPLGSDLGTLDVWMMRHLDHPSESPSTTNEYMNLEKRLRNEKDLIYGKDTPLGQYQWGVWDKIRTPGYHQDHAALRVHDPVPYSDITWGEFQRPPKARGVPQDMPGQELLFAAKTAEAIPSQWDLGWESDPVYQQQWERRRPWVFDPETEKVYVGNPMQFHNQLLEEHDLHNPWHDYDYGEGGTPDYGRSGGPAMVFGSLYNNEGGDKGFNTIHDTGQWYSPLPEERYATQRAVEKATGFPFTDSDFNADLTDEQLPEEDYVTSWGESPWYHKR